MHGRGAEFNLLGLPSFSFSFLSSVFLSLFPQVCKAVHFLAVFQSHDIISALDFHKVFLSALLGHYSQAGSNWFYVYSTYNLKQKIAAD